MISDLLNAASGASKQTIGNVWNTNATNTVNQGSMCIYRNGVFYGITTRADYYSYGVTSTDGKTWYDTGLIETNNFNVRHMAFYNGYFYIGNRSYEWKTLDLSLGSKIDIVTPARGDIAMSNSTDIIWNFSDTTLKRGEPYENVTCPTTAVSNICVFNDMFWVGSGTMYKSSNGSTWVSSGEKTAANNLLCIASYNATYPYISSCIYGTIHTSSDLSTWTRNTTLETELGTDGSNTLSGFNYSAVHKMAVAVVNGAIKIKRDEDSVWTTKAFINSGAPIATSGVEIFFTPTSVVISAKEVDASTRIIVSNS